jgi:protein phosphatase
MGTTIVLARLKVNGATGSHVGDESGLSNYTSRACYQLTVDDDIASQEVKLGYTLYRDAASNVTEAGH